MKVTTPRQQSLGLEMDALDLPLGAAYVQRPLENAAVPAKGSGPVSRRVPNTPAWRYALPPRSFLFDDDGESNERVSGLYEPLLLPVLA